jgi:polyhydroxyalkanoate synthesis regulator phasin
MSHEDDIDKLLSLIDALSKTVSLQTKTLEDLKSCIEALARRVADLELRSVA